MLWSRMLILIALVCAGCVSQPPAGSRPFEFSKDTFSYANELRWVYEFDPSTGKQTHRKADPPPEYAQHCFVVAKSARLFFQHAEFRPDLPKISPEEYRKKINRVMRRSPRRGSKTKVVIPGYAHLREFSDAHEEELKSASGGAWQSYFQRGHWRMIMPFTRGHQERIAGKFQDALAQNQPPVAHIVTFPELSINHAVLVIDSKAIPEGIEFVIYDPNEPQKPGTLTYNSTTRSFYFPRTFYFKGGKVNVYEHYKGLLY